MMQIGLPSYHQKFITPWMIWWKFQKYLKMISPETPHNRRCKVLFYVAIEASIDLSNHLISQNNFPIPESYADSFKILKDEGVLSPELTLKLMDMARFRNRLVHIYWEVDDEMVYEILNQDINDIRTFLKAYLEFLNK